MDDFLTYLDSAFEQNFVQGEYNEVVRTLYLLLGGILRFGADTLAITPTHIALIRKGVPVGQLDIGKHEQWGAEREPEQRSHWMSHREAMKVILKHDERVAQHVQLVEETPDAVTYRIVASE